jgi:hypothetical protein
VAYSLGDAAFDRTPETECATEIDSDGEFESFLDASYKFNIAHRHLTELRRKDWLWAFFYQFRICGFSQEFEKMAEFLRLEYFDESYEGCDRYESTFENEYSNVDVDRTGETKTTSIRGAEYATRTENSRRLGDADPSSSGRRNRSLETSIVEETVANLRRLAKKSDEGRLEENYYIPVKFFMLTCLSRETQLKDEVSRKTFVVDYEDVIGQRGLAALPRPEKALAFFARLWERTWTVFRTKMDDFSAKESIERYIDVNLRDWMELLFPLDRDFAGGRALDPALTAKDRRFLKAVESPSRSPFRSPSTAGHLESLRFSPHDGGTEFDASASPKKFDGSASPKKRKVAEAEIADESADSPKSPKRPRSSNSEGLEDPEDFDDRKRPLPDFYFMSGTSSQQEALSKRKKAVSFYALACTVISYYLKRVYGVELPRCLRHAPGTITMVGKK